MKRHIEKLMRLVAPALVALWSTAALASTQTGQITITVTDSVGQPTQGVTLQLTSPDLIGGARSETTDASGMARYLHLPPGTYEVVANHPDFKQTRAQGIVVNMNHTTALDLTLQAMSSEIEEIVVTGARPTIDTERMTLGTTVTDLFVENLPTGRSYQSLTMLTPGVVDVNGNGNINVLGSTDYGNQYLLDGINITDPQTNTFSANFNFDAIQEVEILTAGRDAEYGNATGGIVNIVTKSGGNETHADVSMFYRSSELQRKDEDEGDLDNSRLELNAALGGPIVKDKLWYMASIMVPWSKSTLPAPETEYFDDQAGKLHPTRDFRAIYGLGKLTWQAADDWTVKMLLQADPTTIDNMRQGHTIHPDAEALREQGGYRLALVSEKYLTDELFWNTKFAWSSQYLNNKPQSGDYDTLSHYNVADTTYRDNYHLVYKSNRDRYQFTTSLAYSVLDFVGEHQFKAGIDAAYTKVHEYDAINGGAYYQDNGYGEDGSPKEYRLVRMVSAQDTSVTGDSIGLFVQDVWKPFHNLTIRPGLRFDSARQRNWEGEQIITLNMLSPRIGISWDPWGDGKTFIRGGYYRYVDTGFLGLASFAGGNGRLDRVYGYNPVTQEYDAFVREQGGASGVVAKDYLNETWDQQRPSTHELIFGAGRELLPGWGLEGTFTYRYSGNMWEDDESNIIWSGDGTNAIGYVNGVPTYIYSLGALEEAFIRYYGVQLVLNKAMTDDWSMLASYTWSTTQGTEDAYATVAFDRAGNRDYEYGYNSQDIRHVFKLDSSYRLPYDVVIGGSLRYFTGAPYNRYYLNGYYGDYGDTRAERGFDPVTGEELRLPNQFTIDLRLQWQLEQLTGQKVDLLVEGYNVLNARTATAYDEKNTASFGTVTNKLSPARLSLGLRYRY